MRSLYRIMPTFCARWARFAKPTNWRFAHERSVRDNSRMPHLPAFVWSRFDLQATWHARIVKATGLLAWRNWQTRTAQDRMGKPVEVRVLSRAVKRILRADYLDPAFLLAAQRAF